MRAFKLACFLVACGAALQAQSVVGTATSTGSFTLRGQSVSTSLIPSWPLLAGDKIQSGSSTVTLKLKDGSLVQLAPNSTATLSPTAVKVEQGAATYSLSESSSTSLLTSGAATASQGDKIVIQGVTSSPWYCYYKTGDPNYGLCSNCAGNKPSKPVYCFEGWTP